MPKSEQICGRCNSIFESEKHRDKHLESCIAVTTNELTGTTICKAPTGAIASAMEQLVYANNMLTQGRSMKELPK
jgi:hypothetical protein